MTLDEMEREVGRVAHCVLSEYLEHVVYPDEVNAGGCLGFAQDLTQALPSEYTAETWFVKNSDGDLIIHWWVFVNETGLHYDAEAPYGVEVWEDLPMLRRVGFGLSEPGVSEAA